MRIERFEDIPETFVVIWIELNIDENVDEDFGEEAEGASNTPFETGLPLDEKIWVSVDKSVGDTIVGGCNWLNLPDTIFIFT